MKTDAATPTRAGVRPHLALVAVQLFLGSWPVVGKVALHAVPATVIVAFRVIGGAAAFLALKHSRTELRLGRRGDYARVALFSLLGVVLNQLLFVKGLSLSTAVNATLLGTLVPVFTLLASIVLGREGFSARVAAGMAVSALGAVYLINPFAADLSGGTTLGNVILLLSGLFYGAYLALTQDMIRRYGALRVVTLVFLCGSLLTLPLGAYEFAQFPFAELGWRVWLTVLYIVLVPTVAAYYLNAWALGRVPPSVVVVYVYLQPLVTFALAPLVLGEELGARVWLAAALIFAGVGVVTLRRPAPTYEEVSERPDAAGR